MDVVYVILLIFAFASECYGIDCYSCFATTVGHEKTQAACFDATEARTTSCSAEHCSSKFTMKDGIVTKLSRGCANSDSDTCTTKLFPNSNTTVDDTTCDYLCNSNKCNTEKFDSLKTCENDCGDGVCNYLTGECICYHGRSGSNCEVPGPNTTSARKCVQCDSDTHRDCNSSTDATDCPSNEYEHCSAARTSIYDQSDAEIRTIITRGCTKNFVAFDKCKYSDIHSDPGITKSGYYEYTCMSTCSTDGCNVNTPNGVVEKKEWEMQCVQCDDDDACADETKTVACPGGTTHCKSKAVYVISNQAEIDHRTPPEYKLLRTVRECATEPVKTHCTETRVGRYLGFTEVVCEETCQDHGCNTGWPARPKCVTCSANSDNGHSGTCLDDPGAAEMCSFPYQSYCFSYKTTGHDKTKMPMIAANGEQILQQIKKFAGKSLKGISLPLTIATLLLEQTPPRNVTRGCSHYDPGTGCRKDPATGIEGCVYTCSSDNCNSGSVTSIPALFVLYSAVFGWFTQI